MQYTNFLMTTFFDLFVLLI